MEFMETTLSLNEKELNAILDAMMLLDQREGIQRLFTSPSAEIQ